MYKRHNLLKVLIEFKKSFIHIIKYINIYYDKKYFTAYISLH